MRVVLQRVQRGRVRVGERTLAEIGRGLVLLVGVGQGDDEACAGWLAEKIAGLRVFEDQDGKTNLSLEDVGGQVIVVSQFTLYADARKGRRPSFTDAALPDVAEPLVRRFAEQLAGRGVPTQMGQFGAHMLVEIENDGPLTMVLERSTTG
jgi:D-tyrosyl-tRNA(Tyr) deacylase